MTPRRPAAVVLLLLGLAGCGTSDTLAPLAVAQLQPQVAAIRGAVADGDRAGAIAAAVQLRQGVVQLRATETITAERASEVLAAAAEVEAQLALLPEALPPEPLPPENPTSSSTEVPEADGHSPEKGKGRGKR